MMHGTPPALAENFITGYIFQTLSIENLNRFQQQRRKVDSNFDLIFRFCMSILRVRFFRAFLLVSASH